MPESLRAARKMAQKLAREVGVNSGAGAMGNGMLGWQF